MESNWATEHLQTIRTLMERSAVYRRALAPIMLFVGMLGVAAAVIGLVFDLDSMHAFATLWLGAAAIAVAGAFIIARRQALKDKDNFWSPPTRRVGQALLPPLFAGMIVGFILGFEVEAGYPMVLAFFWLLFYGCALHSAGFFMSRGIKLFGWAFIILGCFVLPYYVSISAKISANWVMGFFFGMLHLAYGAYLYLTEKGKNAA
jgi:hypothetical protein